LIKRARIKVERTKNAVRAKINEIKATYCKAKDWNNNTGAGVECQITLQNYVKTLRPYYYDVHEVFMDRASSFAQFTSERNVGCDDNSSESITSMMDSTTGDSTTQNSLTNAAAESVKSPKPASHRVIDVDFTPQQSNHLSVLAASTATKRMLRSPSSSSDPRVAMSDYYKMKAENDSIQQKRELELQKEKLKLEQAKFEREEKKDELDRKRLKVDDNKSLIEAYSEISQLNFETLKMPQKQKTVNMSEEEISAIFPLLECPPKPSWG